MTTQNKAKELRYSILDEEIKESIWIVLQNHTIWKRVFFRTREKAVNVIKMFNRHEEFKKDGDSLIGAKSGKRFTIYAVSQYTKMDDIKYVHEW